MATYPVGLPVGTVTVSIFALIGDTLADPDDLPDAQDVTLTVEFLPTVRMIRIPATSTAYRLGTYSWTGMSTLTAPDGVGSYVLPSTDTPAHDGSSWHWQARVNIAVGSVTTQLTSAPFTLAGGGSVDLITGTTTTGGPLLPLEVQSYDIGALVLPGASLPDQAGQAGKVLTTDGSIASWGPGGGGAVASVAGRTGAVTLTGSDLTDSTATGRAVLAAASAAAARSAIGAGTSSLAVGTTAGTAAEGNDARLSDARTPLAHTHTRADVSDATADGRSIMAAPALPALDVWQASNGTWPGRPSWGGRINWIGYPALTSQPSGATAGDTYMARP